MEAFKKLEFIEKRTIAYELPEWPVDFMQQLDESISYLSDLKGFEDTVRLLCKFKDASKESTPKKLRLLTEYFELKNKYGN